MKGIKVEINEFKRGFSLIIIDQTNPGTHGTYNVVFNSQCSSEYFLSEDQAIDKSIEIIAKYLI